MPSSPDPGYWDTVAAQDDGLPAGWRRHGRRAHLDLIERWVGPPRGRWLKTDLYEERTPDRALLGHLADGSVGRHGRLCGHRPPGAAGGAPWWSPTSVAAASPTGSFAGVLSTSTLDHFDDPADLRLALAELARLLAPGGRLLLTLDNPPEPADPGSQRAAPVSGAAYRPGPVRRGPHGRRPGGGRSPRRGRPPPVGLEHLLHAPHVIGTRPARWRWYEERALPRIDRLARTRLAPVTGHYVAFLAERP